jgi:hypothetical protein
MATKTDQDLRYTYSVRITWDRNPRWNKICSWVIEHIGLPGDRYITELDPMFMQFHFNNNSDRLLFVTAWGHDGL